MSIIIIKKKHNSIIISNELTYPEVLNLSLFRIIEKDMIDGIIPLHATIGKRTVLECEISGMNSLGDLTEKGMTVVSFFSFVRSVLSVVRICEENLMKPYNLFLDPKYIFTDPSYTKIRYVYWPVVNNKLRVTVKDFLCDLPRKLHAEPVSGNSVFNKYYEYFDSLEPFSVRTFERMLDSICGRKESAVSSVRMERRLHEADSERFNSDDIVSPEYNPLEGIKKRSVNGAEQIRTAKVSMYPFLINCRTGDRSEMSRQQLVIGKNNQYCDLCVSDNPAISRKHAMIVRSGNCYYIADCNSSNKTFLNGNMLAPMKQYELHDGDQFVLGNEKFVFHMR